ncbi:MAG TPA: hypothetical protein VND65_09635 [Candidatus Binatia bacterium]|nr:hypothetical protein [Candidatus Binatia bacterium]
MHKVSRYFGAALLSTAIALPLASARPVIAAPVVAAQDHDDHDRDHDRDHRVYDSYRKDYHDWDDREDRAYHRWIEEVRHETYRDYASLRASEQRAYWKWRHAHEEHEEHEHHD